MNTTLDSPGRHPSHDTHGCNAAGEQTPPTPARSRTQPIGTSPVSAASASPLWDSSAAPLLALLADCLDDIERTRIAQENRLRQLTRTGVDRDGEERGFGLPLDQPQVAALAALVDALHEMEHAATLNLRRAMRSHPLGPWVKATVGVGEKQGARLIAVLGDPYWNTLHDRPRSVSELWAYCGLHVISPATQRCTDTHSRSGGGGQAHPGHGAPAPHGSSAGVTKQGDPGHQTPGTQLPGAGVAPTRTRGQRSNWSTAAKTRAYLIAESCIKQAHSPYRAVYDTARAKYAQAVHAVECRRCGPKGDPAAPGTPLSAGHQHGRAMRAVMKELLRDLWRESKRIHEEADR